MRSPIGRTLSITTVCEGEHTATGHTFPLAPGTRPLLPSFSALM